MNCLNTLENIQDYSGKAGPLFTFEQALFLIVWRLNGFHWTHRPIAASMLAESFTVVEQGGNLGAKDINLILIVWLAK